MNLKFVVIFLISSTAFTQSVEDILRKEVCICLKEQFFSEMKSFKCYESLAKNFPDELDEYELEETKNGSELIEGDIFNHLFLKNQLYYFKNCGQYFQTVKLAHDGTIRLSLESAKTDSIEKLNKYIDEYEFNSYFIQERGVLYLKEGNYELALKDFNHLLIEDSTNSIVLYLKAVSLEKSGNYGMAAEYYLRAYQTSYDQRYRIASELMRFLETKN